MLQQWLQIPYGESTLPESWIFAGSDSEKRIPIIFSVFLIRTGNRSILIDAGCETMPDFEMKNFQTPMAALKEQGIEPADITDVIITHAHHDHIECVKYFKQAMIHIQKDAAIAGEKYLQENPHVVTFAEETTIDSSVKVVKIGGHSPGSSVVEWEKDEKVYVFCGDECYRYDNIQNRIPTARSYCPASSKAFIEKYAKAPYVCLLCHDVERICH